jgi:hypothetical protein
MERKVVILTNIVVEDKVKDKEKRLIKISSGLQRVLHRLWHLMKKIMVIVKMLIQIVRNLHLSPNTTWRSAW